MGVVRLVLWSWGIAVLLEVRRQRVFEEKNVEMEE
jgi:hypothetical protein